MAPACIACVGEQAAATASCKQHRLLHAYVSSHAPLDLTGRLWGHGACTDLATACHRRALPVIYALQCLHVFCSCLPAAQHAGVKTQFLEMFAFDRNLVRDPRLTRQRRLGGVQRHSLAAVSASDSDGDSKS